MWIIDNETKRVVNLEHVARMGIVEAGGKFKISFVSSTNVNLAYSRKFDSPEEAINVINSIVLASQQQIITF